MELNLNEIHSKLNSDGHKLLYLCKFGSHLYGTNTPSSDTDYKGIFLPSKASCLLGTAPKHFSFNTKTDRGAKNTVDDLDVNLWSLQYFLNLIGQGETNAIDLLYSYSYRDMVVYDSVFFNNNYGGRKIFQILFEQHKKLFSVKNTKSFVGYAIGQARKYGVKGSRLGVVKKIVNFLETLANSYGGFVNWRVMTLATCVEDLLDLCGDPSYCFVKEVDAKPKPKMTLFVNGSQHHLDITMEEFYSRMKSEYEKYGERAKQAETNEGLDYKALSHAVRAIRQMEMLLKDGKIVYPLACANELKSVKAGEKTWQEIEKLITEGLEVIDRMQVELSSEHELNVDFVRNFVLNCY